MSITNIYHGCQIVRRIKGEAVKLPDGSVGELIEHEVILEGKPLGRFNTLSEAVQVAKRAPKPKPISKYPPSEADKKE